jgi:hypothetical protein
VKTLVSGDELIGEGESRHEAALLEPEDGGKGAREEDSLHSGESNNPSAKEAFFLTQGTVSMALKR